MAKPRKEPSAPKMPVGRPSKNTPELRQEKTCKKCATPNADFGPNKARSDGLQTYCRCCMTAIRLAGQYDKKRWETNREQETERNRAYRQANAAKIKPADRLKAAKRHLEHPGAIRMHNIARKHGEKRATPAWADKSAMNAVYLEARRLQQLDGVARHVDHDVPLKHPLVCGLHVPANLKVMTASDNMSKHNFFDVSV